jgi:putative transposase
MNCPHCTCPTTKELRKTTALGYRIFCCPNCKRVFNERTGTPFNFLEYPTDIVLLVVLWRLRYKLSLRDLAEMFLERGIVFTHETVRDWEACFAPLIAEQLRAKRRGQAGGPGMSMKPTCVSTGNGVISIEPLIVTGIWLTRW